MVENRSLLLHFQSDTMGTTRKKQKYSYELTTNDINVTQYNNTNRPDHYGIITKISEYTSRMALMTVATVLKSQRSIGNILVPHTVRACVGSSTIILVSATELITTLGATDAIWLNSNSPPKHWWYNCRIWFADSPASSYEWLYCSNAAIQFDTSGRPRRASRLPA